MNDHSSPKATAPPHFTGAGDQGRTDFGPTGELSKHDVRLVAYGDCEEANAAIGLALALGGFTPQLIATLASVQDDLFDLAADLRVPVTQAMPPPTVRISEAHIERLERAGRHYGSELSELPGHALPGGTLAAAGLHHARTVVRRAERSLWAAIDRYPAAINPLVARYLGRLSSLLFVLARAANAEHGDTLWRPGASVRPVEEPAAEPED